MIPFLFVASTLAIEVLQSGLQIRPRTIEVCKSLAVTVYELASPRELVELWMSGDNSRAVGALSRGAGDMPDPFGVVLWPGAHLAARLLDTNSASVRGCTVLALGAGTGLEALVAARLGASRVIACDISPLALALLRHGAERAGLANVETQTFDLFSQDALPLADVLVCSDLLYNPELAAQVGRRCGEALTTAKQRGSGLSLLVTDSQRFSGGQTAFTKALLEHLPLAGREDAAAALCWQATHLEQITGSGILIEEDQTYDIDASFISQWAVEAESKKKVK